MKYFILFVVILVSFATKEYIENTKVEKIPLSEPTQVEKFMDKIAAIETPGGGYRTVNKFGMLGRYQFNPSTIKILGFNISSQKFLTNPELQDTVMVRYMAANERELRHIINRYNGKTVKGIKITRASILAGAHFAGPHNVKQFFASTDREGTTDAFGTTLKGYMKRFSNFHLPAIKL